MAATMLAWYYHASLDYAKNRPQDRPSSQMQRQRQRKDPALSRRCA